MPTPQQQTRDVLEFLRRQYPGARYELNWATPLQLLVATVLAAQCTDERVNQVTPALFARYPNAGAFAGAETAELGEMIRPTGTYRNKAKAIRGACRALVERFGGEVPRSPEDLTTLPGVARKTANVVLNTAFDMPCGIIVDTHVARVSRRLGLSGQVKPEAIERDLMAAVAQSDWTFFGPAMVLHGRYVCAARQPRCGACGLDAVCPRIGVEDGGRPEVDGEGNGAGAWDAIDAIEAIDATEDKAMKKDASRPGTPRSHKSFSAGTAAEPGELFAAPAVAAGERPAPDSPLYDLPESWRDVLGGELDKPYFHQLVRFVEQERQGGEVFPPPGDVYNALRFTPYDQVNVLLLGQDPYHDIGQAHGLCFSVAEGVRLPPSLVNMFKELKADMGEGPPSHGCLTRWAEQGVLLLNAVLTVRAHQPNSHKDHGWEKFTDAVISRVNEKRDPVVFVLWGGYAQKKERLIDLTRHTVIKSAHPSPLSAHNGFFGSKPYSKINAALRAAGKPPVRWGA